MVGGAIELDDFAIGASFYGSSNGQALGTSSGQYRLLEPEITAEFVVCEVDLTGDGVVNTQDVLLYLGAWAQGDAQAEWNGDGVIDTRDFLAFLNDWVVGC